MEGSSGIMNEEVGMGTDEFQIVHLLLDRQEKEMFLYWIEQMRAGPMWAEGKVFYLLWVGVGEARCIL